jgi:hypothetical protein
LIGANLSGAMIPMYCKWHVSFVDEKIKIGCKEKSVDEWDVFFSDDCKESFETDRDSEDFKRIKAMFNAYKAYKKTMEDA